MRSRAVLAAYRFGRWVLMDMHVPVLRQVLIALAYGLRTACLLLFNCEIVPSTKIGRRLRMAHGGQGVVIHANVEIGDDVTIWQHVTIGSGRGGVPSIGNRVQIGTGAVLLGGVRIGDDAKIGANAVVLCDVPAGATAVGVPARIIVRDHAV